MREGARVVTSAEDVLEDLALSSLMPARSKTKHSQKLPELQQSILNALQIQPLNIDEIAQKLNRSPVDIMTETSIMEISGLIRREAGNTYALVNQ